MRTHFEKRQHEELNSNEDCHSELTSPSILPVTVLYCQLLYYTASHCIILPVTVLYCQSLYYTATLTDWLDKTHTHTHTHKHTKL